jgi:hypothetical protein
MNLVRTDVPEEGVTAIIMIKGISELRTTLAVTGYWQAAKKH